MASFWQEASPDWDSAIAGRSTARGPAVCSFRYGTCASHELDDFTIKTAGHVIRGVVFDVFRFAELAGPLTARELPGGVRVEETKSAATNAGCLLLPKLRSCTGRPVDWCRGSGILSDAETLQPSSPFSRPHRNQAAAAASTSPATSLGTGFSPVSACNAQNQ